MCPPTACPTRYETGVNRWGEEVLTLFRKVRVPWSIQSAISHETTSTLTDLANRFTDEADVITNLPTELHFTQATGAWSANHYRAALAHMKEAYIQARQTRDQRRNLDTRASEEDSTHTMVPGQRESMERAFSATTGTEAEPECQGSDYLLGKLYKDCGRGRLGAYTNNEITSMIPEPHVIMKKVTKSSRTTDNMIREQDVDLRDPPTTLEQWKRQMRVWVTSLLMAICSHPHQTHLQVPKRALDDFYEWMWGPDLMGRDNPPSLAAMMYAERLAWGRISVMVHKKVPLKEALERMQSNQMFWQKEVADRCGRQSKGTGKGKPSEDNSWYPRTPESKGARRRSRSARGSKGSPWTQSPPPPQPPQSWGGNLWQQPAKSKGKGKLAKTKGKSPQGGGQWASKNPKGEFYCWGWNGGKCTNPNCANLHRCCIVVGKNGHGCNKQHPAISH